MTVSPTSLKPARTTRPTLYQRVLGAAYTAHNYGKSTIGNRSDIENVPIERLAAFYRNYYQPETPSHDCGKFDDPKRGLGAESFAAIPRPQRMLDKTYTVEPTQDGERFVTLAPWVTTRTSWWSINSRRVAPRHAPCGCWPRCSATRLPAALQALVQQEGGLRDRARSIARSRYLLGLWLREDQMKTSAGKFFKHRRFLRLNHVERGVERARQNPEAIS